MKNFIITCLLGLTFSVNAQLPNGSTAPDFTFTDLEGNSHRLYDYLGQGKTVYLDFFACHCPFCWNYEQAGYMSALYDQYGPDGTNEVMVLGLELDANNGSNEFNGISGSTQGNWVEAASFPLINPEGSDLTTLINNWDATFYPLIYAICPDGKLTHIGKQTTENLYAHVASCSTALGVPENETEEIMFFQNQSGQIESMSTVTGSLLISGIDGKVIFQAELNEEKQITLPAQITTGVYLIHFEGTDRFISQRVYLD